MILCFIIFYSILIQAYKININIFYIEIISVSVN